MQQREMKDIKSTSEAKLNAAIATFNALQVKHERIR